MPRPSRTSVRRASAMAAGTATTTAPSTVTTTAPSTATTTAPSTVRTAVPSTATSTRAMAPAAVITAAPTVRSRSARWRMRRPPTRLGPGPTATRAARHGLAATAAAPAAARLLRPEQPQARAASLLRGDEGRDGVADELNRDRREEQARDASDERRPTDPEQAVDAVREPQDRPQDQVDRDDAERDGEPAGHAVGALDEDHRRDDRTGPGQQRSAQRNHRDVHAAGGWRRILGLPGQQVQRDEQQQQTARRLQRRERDVQIGQQLPAEQRERHDHAERHEHRLQGGARPLPRGVRRGQRQEDR